MQNGGILVVYKRKKEILTESISSNPRDLRLAADRRNNTECRKPWWCTGDRTIRHQEHVPFWVENNTYGNLDRIHRTTEDANRFHHRHTFGSTVKKIIQYFIFLR